MRNRLSQLLLGAALVVAVVAYGGHGSPQLIHGLVAMAFLLAQPEWPFGRLTTRLLGLLLAGVLLQLWISPNRWLTLQSLQWGADALFLAALFHPTNTARIGHRWLVASLLAVGLIQVLLLPLSPFINFARAGTLVNPNHTAAYLILCFWLSWRAARVLFLGSNNRGAQWRTFLTAIFAAGIVLCFSLGAMLALLGSIGLFLARRLWKPLWSVPIVLAGLIAVQVIFAHWDAKRAGAVMATVAPTKVNDDTRRGMIRASLQLFVDQPITGNGLGSFAERFPSVADIETTDRVAYFAHHDILQFLSESGLFLFIVAFLLAWLWLGRLAAHRDHEHVEDHRIRQAVLFAGVALLLHSLVDFPWHVPLIALPFCALSSFVLSQGAERNPTSILPLRAAAFAQLLLACAFLLGSLLNSPTLLLGNPEPWMRRAQSALGERDGDRAEHAARKAVQRAPFNADARELHGVTLSTLDRLDDASQEMEAAARFDPKNAHRLIRTAAWLLDHGYADLGLTVASRLSDLQAFWKPHCFRTISRLGGDPFLLRRCIPRASPRDYVDLALFLESRGTLGAAFDQAYNALPNGLEESLVHWFFQLALTSSFIDEAIGRVRASQTGEALEFPSLFHLEGKLLTAKGDFKEATRALTDAARLYGYLSPVWADMEAALWGLEPIELCEETAKTWHVQWPQSAHAHLAESICAERRGELAHALSAIQEALSFDMGLDLAWQRKIHLWNKRGVPEKATASACDALGFRPGNRGYFTTCVQGLARENQCVVLRKTWDETASRWPKREDWLAISAELLAEPSGAVRRCIRAE